MNELLILLAAIEIIAPKPNATLQLVPDCQKAVILKSTMAEREQVFAEDAKNGNKLKKSDKWRKAAPVVFKWKVTEKEGGPWELAISKDPDFAEARVEMLATWLGHDKNGVYSYELPLANLEINTTYYWRLTSNITCGNGEHYRDCDCGGKIKHSVANGVFTTEDLAPRWIEIEGRVKNMRDLGGRVGLNGRRVKQGLIYRGQGLNDNSKDGVIRGRNRLMVEDVKYLTETLGIRTDLDLRTACETASMKVSPLGEKVKFIHHSSPCYQQIFEPKWMPVMAANFRVFCDRANYPIYFHCIAGADRTGALGYVLQAILGVKRQEIETDWESTFYPHIPNRYQDGKLEWNSEQHFNNGFGKYGKAGDSWNRRVELYLMDCGITAKEIEAVRKIMLD